MTAAKNSNKKTTEKSASAEKSISVKTEEKARSTEIKKAEDKAALKSAVQKRKAEVEKKVIEAADKQVMAAVTEDHGINAHYDLNTPLPTFLL